jgi:hypothetical protein
MLRRSIINSGKITCFTTVDVSMEGGTFDVDERCRPLTRKCAKFAV